MRPLSPAGLQMAPETIDKARIGVGNGWRPGDVSRIAADGKGRSGRAIHSVTRLSLSALAMTLTEESDIAAAATIGDRRMPNAG